MTSKRGGRGLKTKNFVDKRREGGLKISFFMIIINEHTLEVLGKESINFIDS